MPDQTVTPTPTPETHAVIHPVGVGPVAVPHESLGNPDHLDALAKTVSEHPAYKAARATEAPAAPEISDTPDYSALNIPVSELTEEGAIENHPDFKKAASSAWNKIQNGRLAAGEAGFTVDRDGNVSHVDFNSGFDPRSQASIGHLNQNIDDDTALALHVHSDAGDQKPSDDDIALAKQIKKPIYVQSSAGLFSVDATGKVHQIFKGTNWMNEKKK